MKYHDDENSPWPRGNAKVDCPRCSADEPSLLAGKVYRSGVCVMDRGSVEDEDVLICLDCGCEFYRGSRRALRPFGVDDEHIHQLWARHE